MAKVLLPVLISVSAAGCGIVSTQEMSRGHNIHRSDTNQIVKGRTTEKDVIKLFGAPTKVRDTNDGRELFYEYTKTGGLQWNLVVTVGGNTSTKSLMVWLDKNGVVTDYAFKED